MKNKKEIKIIISIILILLVIVIGFGILIFNQNKENANDWSEFYINTLTRESKEFTYTELDESTGETINRKEDYYVNTHNAKINFVQAKDNTIPMMIVEYERENKKNYAMYSAEKNDNEFTYVRQELPNSEYEDINEYNYDIRMLYNIDRKEYKWYVYKTDKNMNIEYIALEQFLLLDNDTKDYSDTNKFTKEEIQTNQIDEDGIPIISKFEETFIEIDNIENNFITIGDIHNIDKNELKKSLKTAVTNYKDMNEIVTEEIKVATEAKVTELNNKKEQIKVAEEEKAKKEAEERARAEEEARKKAEEELAKGLKVGKYTLKYGTYKLSPVYEGYNGTIILEQNGKCHFKGNIDPDYQSKKNVDTDATYKVRNDIVIDSPNIYQDGIEFSVNGKKIEFIVTGNDTFSDQWHGYKYSSN